MIDARQLHAWLKVSTPVHKWVGRRVEEYGFEDGADFRTSVSKTGGRPRTDYLLTVDMAKELSMVERTELCGQRVSLLEMRPPTSIRRMARHTVSFTLPSVTRWSWSLATASSCAPGSSTAGRSWDQLFGLGRTLGAGKPLRGRLLELTRTLEEETSPIRALLGLARTSG
ncbi:antA/AntB antirepressor family protein [Sphingomonas crocodyli]|uniref:AntA/AntB antirepressor domain-containing protein n=1 Tax=Sphingomonas crocodyli TaxID=1979270 RepID=A0A437M717_9SPHN|nr:hypothetical protein EOD43_06000 [Sphingomonas crocodyli]